MIRPRPTPGRRVALLSMLMVVFCALFLSACGKKGPVRPLLRAEPAAPGRPEIRQVGPEILLAVDLPERNLDGSPLLDLSELQVFRRESAGGVCSECDEPTEHWRTIDLLAPRRDGQRLTIRDQDVRLGYGYRYRLVPTTSRGISGTPVSLARQLHPFPPAAEEFRGTGFDRLVRLEWSPPKVLAPGWKALGCEIYRSSGAASFGSSPLTSSPVIVGLYNDIGPINGTLYRYQLRCLAEQGGTVVESPASAIVAVTPQPE